MRRESIPQAVLDRVLTEVTPGDGGCLLSGLTPRPNGYRQVSFGPKADRTHALAHRLAWIAVHGDLSDDMTIHHKCFTRACVNVDHLEPLSRFENSCRTGGRDWPMGLCSRGHSDANRANHGEKSLCRECAREWQKEKRERRKARLVDT